MTTLFDRDIHDESGILAAPSSGGIGIAPKAQDPYKEAYSQMSGTQEFFTRLGEFGAGVTGRPSPLGQDIERKRREKLTQMEELKGTVSALEHGVSMVEGLEGQERAKFVEAYAGRLDKIDAGLGETYKRLADRPDLLKKYEEYLPLLPKYLQIRAKERPKEFITWVGTSEGTKQMGEALDRKELEVATLKVRNVMMGYQQLVPPEVAKGIAADGVITASEVLSMQQHLPEKMRLSESQMQAVQRNDKSFWSALGVLHGEKEQEVLATRAKGSEPKSDIGKLKKDLEAGYISQEEYDAKVKKLTTHQPSVAVYSAGLTEAVDDEGNRVFIQPSPQEGVPPRVIRNVKPPPKAGDEKSRREGAQDEATVASVRQRIEQMSQALQTQSAIVGPAGAVRRGVETVTGVVAPGVETPALDYQNNLRLLLSDVRKIVEKDPNLSNQERQNLYEMLGGGTFQTPGSAIRALNNVVGYVEGKASTGKNRDAKLESAVKGAGWSYEPEKYEYRLKDGKVQRKLKDK